MYAIVECGGRQYRAEEGHTFSVEKLPNEVGEQIELDNVLLLSDDGSVTIGQPSISGASVLATVTEQYRGKKIFVWKYKPKKRYRRRRGHRQYYTRLRIDSIVVGGDGSAKAARKAAADKAAAEKAQAAADATAAAKAKSAADKAARAEAKAAAGATAAAESKAAADAAAAAKAKAAADKAAAAEAKAAADATAAAEAKAAADATAAAEAKAAAGATAAAEAKPAAKAPKAKADASIGEDLKLIEGIGPKTQSLLKDAGITTFAQLAAMTPEAVVEILRAAGGRGKPDTWPEQAGLAAAGKMDELKQLQDELNGGRRD